MGLLSTQFIPIYLLLVILSFRYWRQAILFLPFWVVLEGAFRKWVSPTNHISIYFIKDFILLGASLRYASYFLAESRRHISVRPLDFLFLVVTAWCVVGFLNPALPHPVIGILGLKTYLYYTLLMYELPEAIDSKEQLFSYLRIFALFALPVLILGTMQFFSPAGSLITRNLSWSNEAEYVSFGIGPLGNHVRINGTFAYLTEYSGYLSVLGMVLLTLIQVKDVKGKTLLYLIAALTATNMLMTGSRGPALMMIMGAILFLLLTGGISFGRFLTLFMRMIWLGTIATIIVMIWFPQAFEAFSTRFTHEKDIGSRFHTLYAEPIDKLAVSGLFGNGIGTTHQGSTLLATEHTSRNTGERQRFEMEFPRVLYEVGVIGFVIYYAFRIAIAWAFWTAMRRTRDKDLRTLMVAMFLLNVLLNAEGVLFSHVHLFYYWFLSGLLLLVPKLDALLAAQAEDLESVRDHPLIHAA